MKKAVGIIFLGLFFGLVWGFGGKLEGYYDSAFQLFCIMIFCVAVLCFLPKRKQKESTVQKRKRVSLLTVVLLLVAIPFTMYVGIYHLADKKYYFISMMIILETLVAVFFAFERKKPSAREIVLVGILCAAAVFGRCVLSPLSQVKPVSAIVIVAGACFGAEVGFLTGSLSAFCSNFFFSQGAWTPWQMFAFGVLGFLAGAVFRNGIKNKYVFSIFGGISVFLIYGAIMNLGSVLMWQPQPTMEIIYTTYLAGVYFDIIHAVATAIFLFFIAEPMTEKIERIKIKYGIMK